MRKLIRVSTVPMSLSILLKGQLKFLSSHFEVVGVSSSGSDLDVVEKREEVRVVSVEIERQISIFRDIYSLCKLYSLFKKEKPSIVHSITPKAGLLSMVAARFAGVPIRIHTFTGLIFPYKQGLLQKILILMDKVLCSCATNIYPEGKGVLHDLQRYRITSKPLKVIANGNVNGIDLAYFDPSLFPDQNKTKLREELGIGNQDFVFIFVGRLVKDKGINELVSVFDKISQTQTCKVKLLFVGNQEPDLDPLLETTIEKLERNSNIILAGYQKDVRPFLCISDALVFPSYREGFPNVVIQAGAMELPAIVTDISGCNEIIIEGENGCIIAPQNEEQLEEKMLFFLENKEHLQDMKLKTRSLIASRYDQKYVWACLLEEYKRLQETYV